MLCLTAGVAELEDLTLGNPGYPCHVQAAVDWFGPTDFLKMDPQFAESGAGPHDHNESDSPESRFLGTKITEIPREVERANPLTYIHPGMSPILIQHGRKDHLVPVQQSLIFAEKLMESVPPERFTLEILEDADHGGPLFETDKNMERVFAFLDAHLKPFSR
jgi:dipeptidyl aminopeptidase/acylaminoacyl peptidase